MHFTISNGWVQSKFVVWRTPIFSRFARFLSLHQIHTCFLCQCNWVSQNSNRLPNTFVHCVVRGTGVGYCCGGSVPTQRLKLRNPAQLMKNKVSLRLNNLHLFDHISSVGPPPPPVLNSAWDKKSSAWAWACPIFYLDRLHFLTINFKLIWTTLSGFNDSLRHAIQQRIWQTWFGMERNILGTKKLQDETYAGRMVRGRKVRGRHEHWAKWSGNERVLQINRGMSAVAADYKLMCYYVNWSRWILIRNPPFLTSDIDVDFCTHIIYVSAEIQNGTLYPSNPETGSVDIEIGFEFIYCLFDIGIRVGLAGLGPHQRVVKGHKHFAWPFFCSADTWGAQKRNFLFQISVWPLFCSTRRQTFT